MKQSQKTFVYLLGIAMVIVLISVGMSYYKNKAITEDKTNLSFESKAYNAALDGECGQWGKIGEATLIDEENEYALFRINDAASTRSICVVDLYAGTVETPLLITNEDIPGPRKTESDSIKKARNIANTGECYKQGNITSPEGNINMYGGGQQATFRVSSRTDGKSLGMCIVNVDSGSTQFITPAM